MVAIAIGIATYIVLYKLLVTVVFYGKLHLWLMWRQEKHNNNINTYNIHNYIQSCHCGYLSKQFSIFINFVMLIL